MNSRPLKNLLDIVFPRACAGCGGNAGDEFRYLCWNCLANLKLVTPPYCLICGDPVPGAISNSYACSKCARHKPHFDCARSAAIYSGLTKEMILDFKYRGAVWLGPDLGQLMAACLRANFHPENIDAIACVPLHRTKEKQRTYNQAFLLAGEIAARTGIKTADCLARVEATGSQTHLTSAARADNVRNTFIVKGSRRVEGQGLLLVDDVMTTGATVNECARVLKEAGAREVLVLTAARG